jgi:trans-aconitate methyltransferase
LNPKLYTTLAPWFHLLSAPADYAGEAEFVEVTLVRNSHIPVRTILELGSGGGNNASHLKTSFDMTLVDISPPMLELSRTVNPECEHIVGDMRTVRLGREFDAVFVHDAVMYMITLEDLRASIQTAFVHCKAGGMVVFMPDFIRETIRDCVHHGGHDGNGRSLRYFEWTFDPDPSDGTYTVDFVYLLREGSAAVRVEHDQHLHGLFSRDEWLGLLRNVGFEPKSLVDPYDREIFVAAKTTI